MNARPAIASTIAGLALLAALVPAMTMTGDEALYAAQGVALASTGSLHVAARPWRAFLVKSGLPPDRYPPGAVAHVAPAAVPSALYAVALRAAGLGAARWLAFAIVAAGLAVLGTMLASGRPATRGALVLPIVAFSLPLVAYARLLYPDGIAFALVAFALAALRARRHALAFLAASALPFVHVRALPLSATLAVVAAIGAARTDVARRTIAWAACGYVAALAVLVLADERIYGTVAGPAFPAFTPALALLPERLGMQLFDVRHGLLTVSPIYAFGIAGLAAALLRRDRFGSACAVACAVYVATFAWSTASESWPARFWVPALPFLAVGLTDWFARVRHWTAWLPIAPCAAITAANVALYCRDPDWFLENRRASVTYAELFFGTHVHLGLHLPIDATPGGLPSDDGSLAALCAWFGIVLALLLASAFATGRWRIAASVGAFAIVAVPLASTVQATVPPADYRVRLARDGSAVGIDLRGRPAPLSALQLDAKLAAPWVSDAYPQSLRVTCIAPGGEVETFTEPSRPIVTLDRCGAVRTFAISADPPSTGRTVFRPLGDVTLMRPIFAL